MAEVTLLLKPEKFVFTKPRTFAVLARLKPSEISSSDCRSVKLMVLLMRRLKAL